MTADFDEKRSFQRMAVDSDIEYRLDGGEPRQGKIRDLSASGVRFTVAQEMAPGTHLRIVIRGGAGEQPLSGLAVVLRCSAAREGYDLACSLQEVE